MDQALLILYKFYIGASDNVLKARLVSVVLYTGKKTACVSTYVNVVVVCVLTGWPAKQRFMAT